MEGREISACTNTRAIGCSSLSLHPPLTKAVFLEDKMSKKTRVAKLLEPVAKWDNVRPAKRTTFQTAYYTACRNLSQLQTKLVQLAEIYKAMTNPPPPDGRGPG